MDYEDLIYDSTHSTSFKQKIEKTLYNAALKMNCDIRGTSKENQPYQQFGLESLQ